MGAPDRPALPAGFDVPPSGGGVPAAPPPAAHRAPAPTGWARDDELSSTALLRDGRPPPPGGWRRALFTLTGGLLNPGESRDELRRREFRNRARTPADRGHHRVAVLGINGGEGRAATAVGLGSALAEGRGDRVIALDADPGRGALARHASARPPRERTVRDLLAAGDTLKRYADVRSYTGQLRSRLELLACAPLPVGEAFTAREYRDLAAVAERFYSVCVIDCDADLPRPLLEEVLSSADQIVLVTPPSPEGVRGVTGALDRLSGQGHDVLARGAVVAVCAAGGRGEPGSDRAAAGFALRCRSVVTIPHDAGLAAGAAVEPAVLRPVTRRAYLRLAVEVASGFAAG
ncbi:MinD-like ATPase involved in chromosome partitioning or flagellar assembly [Marinactinospora thermotolerans DSM 45154]|uniref:MinD-like ATPase involved in chromosome partitioning or flagellar assembly n=1 Tax=Marinactinospora thermotolerans DSM 45154 TaxID=1122192 RepID=A0A1T4RQ57_9ACTN|nr:MinD/ParA family protein [Marinactinospora thermotolerans]SKA17868.1 MinD-like ATPase involved in chromosome partitioning or flagellar assembly [Marinactinospora thermotolerans DSM 45154]